jgi:hypothetical protein
MEVNAQAHCGRPPSGPFDSGQSGVVVAELAGQSVANPVGIADKMAAMASIQMGIIGFLFYL